MDKYKIYTVFAILFTVIMTVHCVCLLAPESEPEKVDTVEVNVVLVAAEPVKKEEIKHEESIKPQVIDENFNILTPCGYTQEQFEQAMAGESYKEMLPYVKTIMQAEEEYGVNALYLICKFGLESGWGKYMAAKNNIGGWTTDSGGYKEFESVEECILHIAKSLSSVYKDAVGTRLEDVCYRYCQNDGYLQTLMQIMIEFEYRMNE